MIAPSTPADAARLVVTAMSAKRAPTAPSVEPGLKPNQPNQRIRTPSTASGIEWPGIGCGLPFASNLPMRAPSMSVPASAALAPQRWTTVEPAKSCMPRCARKPPPQIQCPTSG